jgi:uncharacterized protein (DUF2249 family)/quercetin dioxygenase-like cupin family protein
MAIQELDVRGLRKPDKHPAVFQAYDALDVGGSVDLVNDHDPQHLREELEVDHPGSHRWEYLDERPTAWRIRITKLSSRPLPRVLCDTAAVVADAAPEAAGALWKLPMKTRDLDSNLIQLPPFGTVEAHAGPDLDVLVHVVHGAGLLTTELDVLELQAGSLVWLPRRSPRAFTAGAEGLQYLTVHRRRQGLSLTAMR